MTNNTIDPVKHEWDVIIVGTGMGGATLGYALAKAGKSVLFCEKGHSCLNGLQTLSGDYAESFFDVPGISQAKHHEILTRAGRWTDKIEDRTSSRPRKYIPFIGSGTGGSSALYGMALERFFPSDFCPRANFPMATEANLVENWPISYEELRPYYEAAERLYRVHGELDPLRDNETSDSLIPAPPFSPANQEMAAFLKKKGLHPYHLPLACEYVAGCQGCQGYLCAQDCKNDSGRICLAPALTYYGAHLLDRCKVLRLKADSCKVTGVVCSRQDKEFTLRSDLVVLAAGALETPALLLKSASNDWPQGLANNSDLVGRNLMRHCIDLYPVFTKKYGQPGENVKEIAFNDLYETDGLKLGSVQSFGYLPPIPIIVEQIEQDLRDNVGPLATMLFKPTKPLLRRFFYQFFSRSLVFASIMEDLPYLENRVLPSRKNDRIILKYQLHSHEKTRIKAFRRRMGDVLKPYRYRIIKQAENNSRIAHACGTCRFGKDEQDSVLNSMNRAHGVSNLYIVDSSFFPSSAGTNPSLTIAANALRVAQHLSYGRTC